MPSGRIKYKLSHYTYIELPLLCLSLYSNQSIMDRVRVGFLGSPKVGKTSIITQFLHHFFVDDTESTIDDYYEAQWNGVKLEMIDMSGWQLGTEARLRMQAIEQCNVLVLVFAVNDLDSLETLQLYKKEDKKNLPFILVGNKMDLLCSIPPTKLRQMERLLGKVHYPLTAKHATNIDGLFDEIVRLGKQVDSSAEVIVDETKCCILL
jgi:small GTP-binding protein